MLLAFITIVREIYWFGSVYSDWFFCSSLLGRSSFLQTCTILRRLAKGCVHAVQRWWVLGRGVFQKCYSSNGFNRPARLSRKKVIFVDLNHIELHIDRCFLFIYFLFKKRFSETVAVAALTMLVSRYKITVKEEPQFTGETFEERKTRVLKCWNGLTLTWVSFTLFKKSIGF